jgi:hypothetical protein
MKRLVLNDMLRDMALICAIKFPAPIRNTISVF